MEKDLWKRVEYDGGILELAMAWFEIRCEANICGLTRSIGGETYVTRFRIRRIFFLYSELISNRLSQYSDTGVNNDFRQRWSGFLTFLKNRFHVPPSSYFRLDRFHVFPLRRSCHFSLESLLRSTWIYQTWEEVPDFSNEGIERIISLSSLSLLSIYFE